MGQYCWFVALVFFAFGATLMGAEEMTVTRSRSTNTPEISVKVLTRGAAQPYIGGTKSERVVITAAQRTALWEAARAASPLAQLPVRHCAKSVSFGTTVTVAIGDDRSPDLSCANQSDPRVIALAKEAEALLQMVKSKPKTGKYN